MPARERSPLAASFLELIRCRRSIRVFADAPVGEALLRQILEAAGEAPSAGNLQSHEIYVVRDRERRHQLAQAALAQDFVAAAPVVLAFCANRRRNGARYGARGQDLYAVQDATIPCTFAMLAAASFGLATVWVGAFLEDKVRRVIGARRHERPIALLPVGVRSQSPERPPRRSLDDLAHEP